MAIMKNLGIIYSLLLWSTAYAKPAAPPLGHERATLLPEFKRRATSFSNETNTCSTCPLYEAAPMTTAPKVNVWSSILPEDNAAVWNLLHDPASGLNLTAPSKAKINDNYVYYIDTVPLNKTADVLPYLDADGPMPAKYARVIIFEGGKAEPVSQEYMVGPLPVGAETTIQTLDYLYNGGMGGSVPFNGRAFDGPRNAAMDVLLASVTANISDIMEALVDGVYYGQSDPRTTLLGVATAPTSFDGTQAFGTVMFRKPGPAAYLRPLDFYVILDLTGTDVSLHKLRGFVTNTRFFPSVADLRTAFEAGELTEEFRQPYDETWAYVNHKPEMGQREMEHRLAPQSVELGGKRYRVDAAQGYVEYMGWSFYTSHSRSLGLMFHDIRFKGERILYELSMQEAAAQYGGFQPKAAQTLYHDTFYDLGAALFPLVEGFDCPFGATFWNVSFFEGNGTTVNPNAVCLFETDAGFPLSRHRAGGGSNDHGFLNLGVVKASQLTVRAIVTVGNYDYLFDYAFHVDGSLEITVRASGYLQASPYYADQGNWGPRISEATQGSLHDHVLTWKADFDILDTKNNLQVTEIKAKKTEQPWFPELGVFEQLELEVSNMATEQQFNWGQNGQTMYCINHASATNKWGTARGYRIVPGRSNMHLSIQDSPFSRHNTALSKSQLAVTRQHDNEPLGNSVQNLNMPWRPPQDFAKFFDGESVEGEDLVVWFNLGMHHFTRAEDVPVTLYTEAVSSIMFAPQNFFDQAQDSDLLNRRWITPAEGSDSTLSYNDFGVELPQCQVNLREPTVMPITHF